MKELGKYLKSIGAFNLFGRMKPWADFVLWNETAFPFSNEVHTIRQFKKYMADQKFESLAVARWVL